MTRGFITGEHNLEALSFADAKRSCFDKQSFANKNRARDFAARIKKSNGHELAPYRCMVCAGWHLTRLVDPNQRKAAKNAIRNRAEAA